jgi:cyclophilin family peptidyl-prolyl cis-trans isomerase
MKQKQLILSVLVGVILLGIILFLRSSLQEKKQNENLSQNEQTTFQQETSTTSVTTMNTTKALITTNKGNFELELWGEYAPKTVENFITLAESGFYNGVKFHRIIEGFMIQGGDPQSKDDELEDYWGTGGPGYTFADEIHSQNRNDIGTISMANAGPNTNGSQFFINTAPNNFLDTKHTVFGKVTSGMDVIMEIEKVDTFPNDRPIEPVIITNIAIEK